MAQTDLDICNRAIDRVSGDRIEAFGEDSPLGVFCTANWPIFRDWLLSKYRWSFASTVAQLLRDGEAEARAARPYAYAYKPPADLVGAVHAWRDSARLDASPRHVTVASMDGALWSDTTPLFAEYTARVVEARWPGWMVRLATTAFAADMADFCQNRSLARDLRMEAFGTPGEGGEGGLYRQAREEDARQAPPRQLVTGVDAGPLVGARQMGGFGRSFGSSAPVTIIIGGE
ncbi:MAG: hypothetical protein ACK4E3_10495 [Brevundimonas sp.]|uniref:hypothetical protein n=1 Tax=Brevundimonas sp. TaxID=1871086 RepID=UPI00391B9062